MRKALLVFLLLIPAVLFSQSNTDRPSRKLMIKIPFINGGLGYSVLPIKELPIQKTTTIESFGFGLWYFTKGKMSYQAEGDFKLVLYRYGIYSMVNGMGTRTEQSRSYIRPQITVGANYFFAQLTSIKFYAFGHYQLGGGNWQSREFLATGPETTVNSTIVGESQFDDVYSVYLTSDKLQHSIKSGLAVSNLKNSMVVRFWLSYYPAQNHQYVAESLSSDSKPDIDWTEKGRADLLFGLSFEFNAVLRGMSSF